MVIDTATFAAIEAQAAEAGRMAEVHAETLDVLAATVAWASRVQAIYAPPGRHQAPRPARRLRLVRDTGT